MNIVEFKKIAEEEFKSFFAEKGLQVLMSEDSDDTVGDDYFSITWDINIDNDNIGRVGVHKYKDSNDVDVMYALKEISEAEELEAAGEIKSKINARLEGGQQGGRRHSGKRGRSIRRHRSHRCKRSRNNKRKTQRRRF